MPVKTPKNAKKDNKISAENSLNSYLKVHWLQDSSVEMPVPASVGAEAGQREMAFSASVKQIVIPQDNELKLEMWLRINIQTPQYILLLSEICYSGVADKTSIAEHEGAVVEELYQHAKPQVEALLAAFGHNPPLPIKLNQ